jgi:hypothetical protein
MTTQAAVRVETMRAVLDSEGHVVVLFAGNDADEAAQEWAERGYRIETIKS